MRKFFFWWVLILLLVPLSVQAQEVGDSTEEILNNVSKSQKPYAVTLDEEECKILGIFNCLQPKVDYTHENRLPDSRQIADTGLTFWQRIGNFFKGLFDKSSDKRTGYGYTYLPQKAPVGEELPEEAGEGEVGGLTLESSVQETHDAVKNSYLPYALASKITPQAPPAGGATGSPDPGDGGDGGDGDVPPASGNSVVDYAHSLYNTTLKSCNGYGKDSSGKVTERTKTLAGTITQVPASKEPVPITCLQGKVDPEVYIDLKASADGNSWLQCVGFVIGLEQSQGNMLASMNAKDYCLGATPPGYTKISKSQIAPGDIVANTAGGWGHIMTVMAVAKGSRGYDIAEANWIVSGGIGFRTIYDDDIDCVLRRK